MSYYGNKSQWWYSKGMVVTWFLRLGFFLSCIIGIFVAAQPAMYETWEESVSEDTKRKYNSVWIKGYDRRDLDKRKKLFELKKKDLDSAGFLIMHNNPPFIGVSLGRVGLVLSANELGGLLTSFFFIFGFWGFFKACGEIPPHMQLVPFVPAGEWWPR